MLPSVGGSSQGWMCCSSSFCGKPLGYRSWTLEPSSETQRQAGTVLVAGERVLKLLGSVAFAISQGASSRERVSALVALEQQQG